MAQRTRLTIAAAFILGASAAVAQSSAVAPHALPRNGGAGLRSGAITATGATVPNPKAIPTAPRSVVRGRVHRKNAGRTNYGICKHC